MYEGPGSVVSVDCLQAGWSNPSVGEIFHVSRQALGPTQPPVQWVLGLSQG